MWHEFNLPLVLNHPQSQLLNLSVIIVIIHSTNFRVVYI